MNFNIIYSFNGFKPPRLKELLIKPSISIMQFANYFLFDILYYDIDKPGFGAVDALNDSYIDDKMDYKSITCQYIL